MKILCCLPAARGVYPPEAEAARIRLVESYSTPTTQVVAGFPTQASGFSPFGGGSGALEAARNHILMAERAIQAEEEGYDAFTPYGMFDFGVELARTRCKFPVVAQAQATFCVASMMATRVGAIWYQSSSFSHGWRQTKEYGYDHLIVGFGAVEMPNPEMPKRRQELYERFVSEGKRLVKAGAELIVAHGMSMCPQEYKAAELAEGIGVPVLEGLGCAIAMAETWVRLGTPYSRIRYPGGH